VSVDCVLTSRCEPQIDPSGLSLVSIARRVDEWGFLGGELAVLTDPWRTNPGKLPSWNTPIGA